MTTKQTLLSDFDLAVEESLLTSEPDPSSANSIQQIMEIASKIKARASNMNQKSDPKDYAAFSNRSSSLEARSKKVKFTRLPPDGHTIGVSCSPQRASSITKKKGALINGASKKAGEIGVELAAKEIKTNRKNTVSKKQHTHRSKHGCWTCRLRHKACPEDGSPCGACTRLGLKCDQARQRPSYMVDATHANQRLQEIRAITDKLRRSSRI